MRRRLTTRVILIGSVLLLALGWTVFTLPPPAVMADAPNPALQSVLDTQICPALKNIKGETLTKYCKDYSDQSSLDNAEKKICDKYGKHQLKSECQAYTAAKSTGATCDPGDATCSTCGSNPDASGCPCADGNPACADNAVNCDFNGCDLIQKYINPAIDVATASFGLIAAGSLILGGINYTSSEGDPQKASQAKSRISKTIMALIAYIFLYSFLQFIVPGGIFNR